jgi:hypothetical protein
MFVLVRVEVLSQKSLLGSFLHALDLCSRASGLFDLIFSRTGKAMGRDIQDLGDFAVSEDNEIVLRFLDQAALVEDLRRYLVSSVKVRIDLPKTDLDPLLLEDIRKASFRQTSLERHLPALKTGATAVTRPRLLAFVSASRSLSKT